MKIGFDKKKSTEALAGLVQNTVDAGKKLADNAKDGVASMVEKSKSDSLAKRIKKYNPLFPEEFRSEEFHLPKVIMIVDDVERRDIDVCQGAMGWRSQENKTEILWLYEKDWESTGIQFIPNASCNGVYYVDPFNANRYIHANQIFSKAQDEKVAELKHIANALGAKRCVIEIRESTEQANTQNRRADFGGFLKGIRANGTAEEMQIEQGSTRNAFSDEAEFEGNPAPQRPNLKWFANTDSILMLIESRCNGENTIKKNTIKITGESVSTMSYDIASSIDAAMGKMTKAKIGTSMMSNASKENRSTLYFQIEF